MTKKFGNVFFDLDGTIIDPVLGITGSYKAALKDLGVAIPSDEVLQSYIGPPLRQCLGAVLKTSDPVLIEKGVERYRHYYVNEKYMYKDAMYPDVEDSLRRLHSQGRRLFVATSKAQSYSRDILENLDIAKYFVRIYGSELDGTRADKTELIRFIVDQERVAPESTLMIGDRKHDVIGAKGNGIACIGVTYGYGSSSELSEAGCVRLCASMKELPEHMTALENS